MLTRFSYLKSCVLMAASLGMISTGFAKMEQWTDTQGNAFKAEPSEVIGPFALFRLPNRAGKLLPLNMLSPKDCVRFAQMVSLVPAPAADWSESKTVMGQEIKGGVLRVQDGKLEPADLKGVPEPRLYVLYFASNGEGKSWGMLGQSAWRLPEVQQKFPGMVEGLMFGVKHSSTDHEKMAIQMKVRYLVADYSQENGMDKIARLAPNFGYGVVVCNSGGVPLFLPVKGETDEEAKKIMTDLTGILGLLQANNPGTWAPRLYYWKAVQPALHASDKCEPMLIGDPLNVQALRERSVNRFEATLFVSAEGAVTAVSMVPGADIPEALVQPISEALQQAQFVAAVDAGKFVAGKYLYRFGAK